MPLDAHPFDETSRLAALHALALLDTDPEREFEALVALAAEMLDCPTALLTLIDRDRLWIKASNDGRSGDVPREQAFCDHTIRGTGPMVVGDMTRDPRFERNPMVATEGGVRFYAGTPIKVAGADGMMQPIGALCVLDTAPRQLTEPGRAALAQLATLAESLLHARRTALDAMQLATARVELTARLERSDAIFRQAERMAQIGSWRVTLAEGRLEWSDGVYRIHGLEKGDMPSLDAALDFYPPHARARVSAHLAEAIETGKPFDLEEDFVTAGGEQRRVRAIGEIETVDGRPDGVIGVFQDVTDRHQLETVLRRSAHTDALTGVANRAGFDRYLTEAMERSRCRDTPLTLFLIDLDGFKTINDTLGHGAGDDVLRTIGRNLRADWLRGSYAARLGGDEFAVLVEDAALAADPAALAVRIEDALRFPVSDDMLTLTSAGTVGWAVLDAECGGAREFVHAADMMLYTSKRARIGDRRRGDRRAA